MDDKIVELLLALLGRQNTGCCNGGGNQNRACGCTDDAAMAQFQHTLVRFNEQAAQQSSRDMETAANQSHAMNQHLLKMTAEITKPS